MFKIVLFGGVTNMLGKCIGYPVLLLCDYLEGTRWAADIHEDAAESYVALALLVFVLWLGARCRAWLGRCLTATKTKEVLHST
jgi:hypothetical protein